MKDDIAIPSLNELFERTSIENEIKDLLVNFNKDANMKKGIYLYGSPGCGKSYFITTILKELNYDIITYNAGDVRNQSLFHTIDNNHLSNCNVLDLMHRRKKKIAIIMDEIDGMNSGDKGGIDALIKLVRPKKTKKQKLENTTLNPIICIGSLDNDKKIRELMKSCNSFELKLPTHTQMRNVLYSTLPPFQQFSHELQVQMLHYIQGDLRKMEFMIKMWKRKPELMTPDIIQQIFHVKLYNEDAKKITRNLFERNVPLDEHTTFMNETERTTVALLWHENIADVISNHTVTNSNHFPFYVQILNNICFADYIGRITFQSQIWQFNEMTSLIKTFYNNKLSHEYFGKEKMNRKNDPIEFTKVLTKYSTEYNNQVFLQGLCQKLHLDKKDVLSYFQELRLMHGETFFQSSHLPEYLKTLEYQFTKDEIDILDVKRMYRFLDKNVKKDMKIELSLLEDDGDEDDDDTGSDISLL